MRSKKVLRIISYILITVSLTGLVVYKVSAQLKQREINARREMFIERNKAERKQTNEKKLVDKEKYSKTDTNEIGYIEIKKINLLLPIFNSTGSDELREGSGIVEGTDKPSSKGGTTSVIAGHRGGFNEDRSFLNIDELKKGENIIIETNKEQLKYTVVGKKIIKNDDWSQFYREKDKSKLILMTCHPYPTNRERLLVISELQDKK